MVILKCIFSVYGAVECEGIKIFQWNWVHSKALTPNVIVTKFYQKLTNILEVMTFNVYENQENCSFFQVF